MVTFYKWFLTFGAIDILISGLGEFHSGKVELSLKVTKSNLR